MAKQVLGRGLGALLGGSPAAKPAPTPPATSTTGLSAPAEGPGAPASPGGQAILRVPTSRVRPGALQPRKDFSDESIQELADSIRRDGLLQPLVVRLAGDGYELIAGERRWRAARSLGLAEVPVLVREADDQQALELALIENLQREDLNPIEEATAYGELMRRFNLTQEEVALRVGKNRATVANSLRLLQLPPEIREYIRLQLLSTGHAKALLSINNPELLKRAAEKVRQENLNVRQTEQLANQLNSVKPGATTPADPARPATDPHLSDLQSRLQQRLGTKVAVKYRQGKGALEIKFFNDEDLNRILELLGISLD